MKTNMKWPLYLAALAFGTGVVAMLALMFADNPPPLSGDDSRRAPMESPDSVGNDQAGAAESQRGRRLNADSQRPDTAPGALPDDELRRTMLEAMGADEAHLLPYALQEVDGGFASEGAPNNLNMQFTEEGVRLSSTNTNEMELAASGVGCGSNLRPVERTAPRRTAINRVEYQRGGGITERYVNDDTGLEQSFELSDDLGCGADPVVIELQRTENWSYGVAPDGSLVMHDRATGNRLRDVGMATVDSTGTVIPSEYVIRDGRVQIQIDADNAAWPLTVE